jgi:hypothetical protein
VSGNQRWGTSSRIDVGDANLACIEAAAFHEGGPLLKLGCPGRYGNGFSLQIFRALDVRLLQHHDRGWVAPEDSGNHLDAHAL